MTPYKKRSEWELLVKQFLESNETVQNFCTARNLHVRGFKNWCYKLNPKNNSKIGNIISNHVQSNFVKLTLLTTLPDSELITVKLPNGIVVEIKTNNLLTTIK